jgi:hypothetical protein
LAGTVAAHRSAVRVPAARRVPEVDMPVPTDPPSRRRAVHRRWAPAMLDAGMATAEYAIATLAACGFAGLLVALLRSGEVRGLLLGIVRRALSVG